MPEEDADREGVLTDLIKTFKADTLEELAEKFEIKDKEEFKKTIARYNEMAKNKEDRDFSKDVKYLYPIENPPYKIDSINYDINAIIFESILLLIIYFISTIIKMI